MYIKKLLYPIQKERFFKHLLYHSISLDNRRYCMYMKVIDAADFF